MPFAVEARTDEIFLTNFGPDPTNPGFEICAKCGDDVRVVRHSGGCRGMTTRVALLHSFITDVLVFAFDVPAAFNVSMRDPAGQTVWRSVATAIARAASPALQIDPDELKVGVRTWNPADPRRLGELFIYDDVPNGAGYARQIGDQLPALLRQARDLMRSCNCSTACYSCLLDYRNQFWHDSLDRFACNDALSLILDGSVPLSDPQRAEHCARVLIGLLADLRPVETSDDTQRPGLLVESGSLFVVPVPSVLSASSGTTTVHGRKVGMVEVTDFEVLRRPMEAIRAVRAAMR